MQFQNNYHPYRGLCTLWTLRRFKLPVNWLLHQFIQGNTEETWNIRITVLSWVMMIGYQLQFGHWLEGSYEADAVVINPPGIDTQIIKYNIYIMYEYHAWWSGYILRTDVEWIGILCLILKCNITNMELKIWVVIKHIKHIYTYTVNSIVGKLHQRG